MQSVFRTLLVGVRRGRIDLPDADRLIALTLTLVRRKVARHCRKLKREHDLTASAEAGSGATLVPSPQPGPASTAEYNDQLAHLLSYLDDDRDRQLVELRLQGLSTAEVARQLGVEPASLRVRLGRLRERLRERGALSDWI